MNGPGAGESAFQTSGPERVDDQRPPFVRRLRRRELILLDAAGSVGYCAVYLSFVLAHPLRVPHWVACLVVAAIGLPLAVRRLWPRTVLCVVLSMTLVSAFMDLPGDSFLAAAMALYLVALTRSRAWRRPTLVVAAVSSGAALVAAVGGTPQAWRGQFTELLYGLIFMCGAWTVGRAVAGRRGGARQAAEQFALQAVTEERLRIARELHDVVAHSMSLIAVNASVANHVGTEDPGAVLDAMRVIEDTSRGALTEMRHLLGVLRTGTAQTDPAPGLTALPQLAGRAALAGVRVDLDVDGLAGAELPAGVELAVYRIVQEAVTNVIKHAAPAGCRVEVAADERAVTVTVVDDGPGTRLPPGLPGRGHGLIGMRERVMVYGGSFEAGPGQDGGFRVAARIPYAAPLCPVGEGDAW